MVKARKISIVVSTCLTCPFIVVEKNPLDYWCPILKRSVKPNPPLKNTFVGNFLIIPSDCPFPETDEKPDTRNRRILP